MELQEQLTFDDILLTPAYSAVLPSEVLPRSSLSDKFPLAAPILSAAMDTVTESAMAIAIAQFGGLGVLHKNMSAQQQVQEVQRVKRFEGGIVQKPITVSSNMNVGQVREIKEQHGFSGLPVVNGKNRVCGIVTNRDMRFETRSSRPITEVMTPCEKLVSVRPGYSLREVKKLLHEHRIERVVIMDSKGMLCGLVTVRDILRAENFPDSSKDVKKRLRVAAAIGVQDEERAAMLAEAGADALVLDSAHGHSKGVLEFLSKIKKMKLAGSPLIIAGNIATAQAAKDLTAAGADVLKVGIGPGSICTTRIVAGIGVPQFSAIQSVAQAAAASVRGKRKRPPTIIADGGLRYSGDIAKAIAAGADAVMVGGMLAGTDESPGEIELFQGRTYKRYRGMGSLAAMRRGSGGRYAQQNTPSHKLVPEGVEGRVPYKGRVADVLYQLVGGLRASMGYVGAADIAQMKKAKYVRISSASSRESHVHDVDITREAPNYHAGSDLA